MRKYTDEERNFFINFVPGHSYKEILDAFNERFENKINISQTKSYIKNHNLNTGRTGRFEKGHISSNKGKKGVCAKGCKKTWFKKGHTPLNHRPVGSERITVDGYLEVKVEEPNRWKLKHRVVWENVNGKIPKGHAIIFLDGNKTNCKLNNLQLVSRRELAILNKKEFINYKNENKKAAINIIKLKIAIMDRKNNLKAKTETERI